MSSDITNFNEAVDDEVAGLLVEGVILTAIKMLMIIL